MAANKEGGEDTRAAAARRRESWRVFGQLLLLCLESLATLWLLDTPAISSSPRNTFAVGVVALAAASYLLKRSFARCGSVAHPARAFFLSITIFASTVDFVLGLALVGRTELGRFYFEVGEEYFKTGYGVALFAWDGVVNWSLQMYLAHSTMLNRPCRAAGFLRCGFILNGMPVLLLGAVTGAHSADLKPSTLLNAPYVLAPMVYLRSLLVEEVGDGEGAGQGQREGASSTSASAPSRSRRGLLDHALAAFHVVALGLHYLRAAVALGSHSGVALWYTRVVEPSLSPAALDRNASSGHVRIQLLLYAFYYAPFHGWALVEYLSHPGPTRALAEWSAVAAGGYLQGQAVFVVACLYEWVGYEPLARLRPAATGTAAAGGVAAFWAVNSILPLLASAFAMRCWYLRGATRICNAGARGEGGDAKTTGPVRSPRLRTKKLE